MLGNDGQPTAEGGRLLLSTMKLTAAGRADPEHFLIALLETDESALVNACLTIRPALRPKSLLETLIASVRSRTPEPPCGGWSAELLSERSCRLLSTLGEDPEWAVADSARRQALLAAAALAAALPRVQRVFAHWGVAVPALTEVLHRRSDVPRPEPFDANGHVACSAFLPSGEAVLQLMETEGKGLGLARIGSPLFLFSLVARENGLLERALRLQMIDPKKLHETLLLHLRALGTRRFNDHLVLQREAMQPAVVAALEKSADLSHERGLPQIGEPEMLRALLLQGDLFVQSCLTTAKVQMEELSHYVFQRHSGEQDEVAEQEPVTPLQEVDLRLRQQVVGQEHAVDVVFPIVKRMRFGYTREARPMGVLLFLGASGTGKTQLAKEIAHAVYGSEEKLIFLEMGQFGSEQSKNIFIGAPPGYVGYGEGLLTNGLRDQPEAVVLFDEVEKAHPSVFDVLLRFLDEGRIADPAGPVRDGRRCLIVLTSNHALDMLQALIEKQSRLKHLSSAERDQVRAEVRRAIQETRFFRPEFLNRVDELILFNDLDAEAYRQIVTNQLQREQQRLEQEKKLQIHFDRSLIDELVRRCCERCDEGARVCGRLIGQLVIDPLIDFFLEPEHNKMLGAAVDYVSGRGVRITPAGSGLAEEKP